MGETLGVSVRPSPIQGQGLFATRDFSEGDIILRRDESREITPDAPLRPGLGEERRHCDDVDGGRVVFLGYPERHLNHSCDSNAYVRFIEGVGHICARREIAEGEEITNDYCINSSGEGVWACACGSTRCRKLIHVNFFEEPLGWQLEHLPFLAAWFIAEYPTEMERLKRAAGRYRGANVESGTKS